MDFEQEKMIRSDEYIDLLIKTVTAAEREGKFCWPPVPGIAMECHPIQPYLRRSVNLDLTNSFFDLDTGMD